MIPPPAEWNDAVAHSIANPAHILGPYEDDDGNIHMSCDGTGDPYEPSNCDFDTATRKGPAMRRRNLPERRHCEGGALAMATASVVRPADGPFGVIGDPCGMQPGGIAQCDQPSTVRNTAACVHEHVSTGVNCARHARWLTVGTWLCGPCLDLGHECPLTITLGET